MPPIDTFNQEILECNLNEIHSNGESQQEDISVINVSKTRDLEAFAFDGPALFSTYL